MCHRHLAPPPLGLLCNSRQNIVKGRRWQANILPEGGKELGGLAKEGSRGGNDDSAFSVRSAGHWLMLDRTFPLQQSMQFKIPQEQQPNNASFNPISATAFQHFSAFFEAFEANQKAHLVHTSQLQKEQFAIHAYQNQDMNMDSASTHHVNDVRFAAGVTVNHEPSGSTDTKNTSLVGYEVGPIFPRKMSKPATTSGQLTIFYAGSVNVYDDVPCDKAHNVLHIASEGCKAAANAVHSISEASAQRLNGLGVAQTPNMNSSHVVLSGLSNTLSLASHIVNQSYVLTDGKVGAKTEETLNQTDASKTKNFSMGTVTAAIILPRAVPQARKASLARFLEKRKERASSSMPYSCDKKTLEICSTSDGSALPSSYSTAQISLTNNQNCSWFFAQH